MVESVAARLLAYLFLRQHVTPTDELVVLAGHHLDAGLVAELDADAIAGREGAPAPMLGALGVGFGHLRDASGARLLAAGDARGGDMSALSGASASEVLSSSAFSPANGQRKPRATGRARPPRVETTVSRRCARDATRARTCSRRRTCKREQPCRVGRGDVWLMSCRIADADATRNLTSKLAPADARAISPIASPPGSM